MSSTSVVSDALPSALPRGSALVSVGGVVKRFDAQVVVHNVSLVCYPGEVVLLLGANGAGKSTLLRIVSGLVRADRGYVQMPEGVRVGYSGHHTGLYSRLSVEANLILYARLAGVSEERRRDLMQRWRLDDVQHQTVAEVSRGAQSKASLVRALMATPHVLVLDEPSSNLDEGATDVLRAAIAERVVSGGVALVATHDLARLGSIATRVVVLERGAVVADSGTESDRNGIDSVIAHYRVRNR